MRLVAEDVGIVVQKLFGLKHMDRLFMIFLGIFGLEAINVKDSTLNQ